MPPGAGEMTMISVNPALQLSARFLRRTQAAAYVQTTYGFPCSRQWLAKLAVIGGGPIFRKAGRTPIYAPEDLDSWAAARIGAPQRSTSDARTAVRREPAAAGGRV
jgi:hypothetical protein